MTARQVIEECSDLCISVIQDRFYGGSGGVVSQTVKKVWGWISSRLGWDDADSKKAEEYSGHRFSSSSQFFGDVVSHVSLSAFMMTLLLGFLSPGLTFVVECVVLLLFIGDEVRHTRVRVWAIWGRDRWRETRGPSMEGDVRWCCARRAGALRQPCARQRRACVSPAMACPTIGMQGPGRAPDAGRCAGPRHLA